MTVSRGNFNRPSQLSPVRVVSTSNVSGTYSNGPTNDGVQATLTTSSSTLTIDGVSVVQNDSVLLVAQTAASQNGIYFVSSAAGFNVVLQRRDDFQSRGQILPGYFVPVAAGTSLGGSIWSVVEPVPVNIGTDSIVFADASGAGFGTAVLSTPGSPFVVASPGGVTAGNLASFSNANGTVADSGIVAANIQLNTVSVTLSQAQVQGMSVTPVQIVAAPGAGKVILPIYADLYTNFQTSAFAGGGVAILQYSNTATGAGANSLAATFPAAEVTAAASQLYSLAGRTASVLTAVTNLGLFFSNQTAAFTGGSASSTLVVTVNYYVVTATV